MSRTKPTAACSTQIARAALPTISACTGSICSAWFFGSGSVHLDAGALAPLRQQRLQLGVGRGRRDAGLQPADQIQEMAAAVLAVGRIQAERQPDLDVVVHHVELRRHHADDFAAHAVDVHGLDRGPAGRRAPTATARATGWRAAGRWRWSRPARTGGPAPAMTPSVVSRSSVTAAPRTRTGRSPAIRFSSPVVNAPDRGERLVQLAELEELRRRDPELVEAHGREAAGQEHQLLGLRVGQRAQQHAVDDREDRGVGADAQGQREDRDQGEPGRAQQAPGGVADIAQQVIHAPDWTGARHQKVERRW